MTGFHPVPVVTIGGVDVATGLGQTQVRPPRPPAVPGQPTPDPTNTGPLSATLIVMDGTTVTWGREDVFEQPDPATGTLVLFDGSGSWGTSLDLRGQSVVLSWTGTPPEGGAPVREAYFRGRVGSPVRIVRHTVQLADGTLVDGSLITLPLVSILLDLANVVPAVDWPAETMEARRVRIAADAAAVLPGGITIRDFWKTPQVAPVAAAQQVSLLDHLVALYDSSGADRMSYLPNEQRVVNKERLDYPASRGPSRLWWDPPSAAASPVRAGRGIYATAGSGPDYYLDSRDLLYDPGDGITQPARITRVQVTHPDAGNGYASRTTARTVAGTNEVRDGIRTASLESLVAWNPYADTAAGDLAELAGKEGAAWRLEPLRFSSADAGFHSVAQARALLRGAEIQQLLFLERSWLPRYGLRPVFGVLGGAITYAEGSWELELNVSPMTAAPRQHAITWEEIDDGSTSYQVEWWDDDNPRGMHESLTLEDLGFVSSGLVGPMGPDTGWDEYLP